MTGPLAIVWIAYYIYKETWGRARADKRAFRAQQQLVSTHNGLSSYSEAIDSPNESWDAFLIQTMIQGDSIYVGLDSLANEIAETKGGWRVPQPDEQPGNPDVWRVLRRAHRAPKDNVMKFILKKMGKKSKDADVRVSDDEPPYKSKNPYLPRNVYEHPPRAHIRTPSGLFVSTAQVWEIQYRAYVYGRQHKFEGLKTHIAELEKRFREQRLIT